MGGPSVAIGIEELSELGVHTFLRVGTCGAAQPHIKMGDLIIAEGSVRTEGTPNGYVPLEYPAIASRDVVNALVAAATAAGAPHHLGVIRSVDALYSDLVPDQMPRSTELKEELAMWSRAGILPSARGHAQFVRRRDGRRRDSPRGAIVDGPNVQRGGGRHPPLDRAGSCR